MGRRPAPKLPSKYKHSGLFGTKPVDVDVDVDVDVEPDYSTVLHSRRDSDGYGSRLS